MKIIAGKAGRITIKVPSAIARPTTDYVRQAIFNILGEIVIDAKVLDLFCGSGALGLESLSRGAKSCTFVDEHRLAISTTEENLKKSRLLGGRTVKSAALPFLKRDLAAYNVIFADPPYYQGHGSTDHGAALLNLPELPNRLSANGLFLLEISSSQPSPPSAHLQQIDRRDYGSSAILIFQHKL